MMPQSREEIDRDLALASDRVYTNCAVLVDQLATPQEVALVLANLSEKILTGKRKDHCSDHAWREGHRALAYMIRTLAHRLEELAK